MWKGVRNDLHNCLFHLFINILLLLIRLVDRIYSRQKSYILAKKKEHPDKSKFSKSSHQREAVIWKTEEEKDEVCTGNKIEVTSGKKDRLRLLRGAGVRRSDDVEPDEEERVIANDNHWQLSDRKTADEEWSRCESLDEVSSAIAESTEEIRRQISAMSDYYSDEEELAKEWDLVKRDCATVDSRQTEEEAEVELDEEGQTVLKYERVCKGLERLQEASSMVLEEWSKRNEANERYRAGMLVSVDACRRRSSGWTLSDDSSSSLTECASQSGDQSVFMATAAPATVVLRRDEREDYEYRGLKQTLLTYDEMAKRSEVLNQRLIRELGNARELQRSIEQKRWQLRAKINRCKWNRLTEGCEVLYKDQTKILKECDGLSRGVVARRKDVEMWIRILVTAINELEKSARSQSGLIQIWNVEKVAKYGRMESLLKDTRLNFEVHKATMSDDACNSTIRKLEKSMEQVADSRHIFERWLALSRNANDILKRTNFSRGAHEERCLSWMDFSKADDFRKVYDRHLKSLEVHVLPICQLHEWRSLGTTGLFRPETEDREFSNFYQRYEQKIKILEEEFSILKKARAQCIDHIEKYKKQYDMFSYSLRLQESYDKRFNEEEVEMRKMLRKLEDCRNLYIDYVMDKEINTILKNQERFLKVLYADEVELKEQMKNTDAFYDMLTDFRSAVDKIRNDAILQGHVDRLKGLADQWQKNKQFERVHHIIEQIENFEIVEDPCENLDLYSHEARVTSFERRLPEMEKLHLENCSTFLATWKECTSEYDELEQEPVPFEELEGGFENLKVYLDKVRCRFHDIKAEYEQLMFVNDSLSKRKLLGVPNQENNSVRSFLRSFESIFRKSKDLFLRLRKESENFRIEFEKFAQLKKKKVPTATLR